MKPAIKRTLSRLVPRARHPGFRVLLYHAVDAADPADRLSLRVTPDAFRAHMTCLKTEGYHVVPLSTLLESLASADEPAVAITFDDGYRSQLQAADILEEFKFPATFFVVTNFLDGQPTGADYWERWAHMPWTEVQDLCRRGFEIGCHSASHRRLTLCAPSEWHAEIRDAKLRLEERLRQAICSFSYPHGASHSAVQRAVQDAGYRLACSSQYGANRGPLQRFAVQRTEICGSDRLIDVRRKLQGQYDWVGHWQRWAGDAGRRVERQEQGVHA